MPESSPFLIGSGYDSPLSRSRIRNLFVLKDIYEKYKSKRWFVILEDQSYLVPSKYAYTFNWKDSNKPEIWGHSTYFFDSNYRFFDKDQTRLFYDVHGGVTISIKLLEMMYNNIDTIANMYASPLIEEEIKLSALASYSYSEFYKEVPYHMSWIFCPSDMEQIQRERPNIGRDVISFANMGKKLTTLYNGNVAEWSDREGKPLQAGFDKYVGQQLTMTYPEPGAYIKFTFGYSIEALGVRNYNTGPIKPVFDDMDEKNPSFYTQKFENFNVTYECDDSLEDGELVSNGDHPFNTETIVVSIKCPNPSDTMFYKENQTPTILNVTTNWL